MSTSIDDASIPTEGASAMDIGKIVREVEALPVEVPIDVPTESPEPVAPVPVGAASAGR
jgi:hypothetical protein